MSEIKKDSDIPGQTNAEDQTGARIEEIMGALSSGKKLPELPKLPTNPDSDEKPTE